MCSLYRSTHLLSSKYNSTYSHYCPNNWQQKWVHPKWTCQNCVQKCQYFVGAPLLSSTALILLGMEFTRAAQVVAGILFHSSTMTSQSCWMLDTWCFSTFRLRMPHMCSIGFRSGDNTWPLHHLNLQLHQQGSCHLGDVFGVIIMLENCRSAQFLRGGHHLLLQNVTVHVGIHVSLNEPQLPSTSSTHAAPDHDATTTMLDCMQGIIFLVFLTRASPHMLDTIWAKQVYLRLIRPQDMVPVIHALGQVVFSKLFADFFVSQLQKRLPSGTTAMQTDLLQCVAYGLSTEKLTFHFCNL